MGIRTLGDKLLALKGRSRMSLRQIVKAGGYKTASAIQEYFNTEYDQSNLSATTAAKLAKAFVGKGDPPILPKDIWSLVGCPIPQAPNVETLEASLRRFADVAISQGVGPTRWPSFFAPMLRSWLQDQLDGRPEDAPDPQSIAVAAPAAAKSKGRA